MIAFLLALSVWLAWTPDKTEQVLLQSYSRPGTARLMVQQQPVFVQDSGLREAPAILLLHGFGASLQAWDDWAPALEKNLRVLRIDIPGFGLSGPAVNQDYSDAADVARVIAVMDQLGVQQVIVAGHSMGGRIAWNLAAAHPERVSKLVLISPDGFPDPNAKSDKTYEVPALLGLLPYSLPKWALRMGGVAPAFADERKLTPQMMQRYHDMMLAPGVRTALLERMRQTRNSDPVSRLQSIKAPTLLLWGEKDAFIPVSNAQDYLKAMPQATLVTLPGVGHVLHEEAPKASVQAVLDFLSLN
ncbi:MAG: alpha/beta hydrolase [Betaproteobacteria bacterium]